MTCETGKKEMDLVHQLQDQVSIFLFSSFYYIYIERLQKKVKLHENSFMYQYEAYSFLKVTGFFKNAIFDPIIVFFQCPRRIMVGSYNFEEDPSPGFFPSR